MTDPATREPHAAAPQAHQRRTRWPGWVWLIPLVAAIFAGWLAVEEWVVGPRSLSVRFATVEGIKPGAPVRYKGVQVGSVDTIRLDNDLGGATLVLDMTALKGRLGAGTRIWIERPSLAPGAIGSLISGPYLAIAPAEGEDVDELEALEEPPILMPDERGQVFVLTDENGEGLEAGAPVRFRGITVGRVLGKRFGDDGAVEIPVFIEGEFAATVRGSTVFWRAGGLALETGAGGLDVDFPSLATIATGAVAFETPEVVEGQPAEAGARFPLWPTRDAAATATTGPRLPYLIVFAEPVGDMPQGAPVTLAGKQIGRVAGTGLEVAPDGSGLVTPVTIVIDARRMGLDDLDTLDSREALRERLNAIIGRLVEVGMRAQVAEGGIVFGTKSVELVINPKAPPATFSPEGEVPVIPAATAAQGTGAGAAPAGAAGEEESGEAAGGAAGEGRPPAGEATGGEPAGETGQPPAPGAGAAQDPAGTDVPAGSGGGG